jgi:plastocyanin
MQPKFVLFGLILASLLLLGCLSLGQSQQAASQTTQNASPPAMTPSFTITSPIEGQIITTSSGRADVPLNLDIQNLALTAPGGAAVSGQGHFRVIVDGSQPVTVLERIYVMSGLVPGPHTVNVELLNNDNTEYLPPIESAVSFVVEESTQSYIPQNYNVTIENFTYAPSDIIAKVGDTLTFFNAGSFPMTATCIIDGTPIFTTPVLALNQAAQVTLDQEMNCTYYSTTQYGATGQVVVESNGTD